MFFVLFSVLRRSRVVLVAAGGTENVGGFCSARGVTTRFGSKTSFRNAALSLWVSLSLSLSLSIWFSDNLIK